MCSINDFFFDCRGGTCFEEFFSHVTPRARRLGLRIERVDGCDVHAGNKWDIGGSSKRDRLKQKEQIAQAKKTRVDDFVLQVLRAAYMEYYA